MKRFLVLPVLAVALAAPAVAGASVTVAGPEFGRCVKTAVGAVGGYANSSCTTAKSGGSYEWVPGPGPHPAFTQAGGAGVFETVAGQKITCSSYHGAGYVSDTHREELTSAVFEGCKLPSGAACSAGTLEPGVLELGGLQGKLGLISKGTEPKKDKVGLELYQFDFGITCGETEVGLIGQVVVPVKPNKMETKETLKFAQSKGVQKVPGFEGEPHTLEMSFTPGYEQAGLGVTVKQTNEEAIEVATVA